MIKFIDKNGNQQFTLQDNGDMHFDDKLKEEEFKNVEEQVNKINNK